MSTLIGDPLWNVVNFRLQFKRRHGVTHGAVVVRAVKAMVLVYDLEEFCVNPGVRCEFQQVEGKFFRRQELARVDECLGRKIPGVVVLALYHGDDVKVRCVDFKQFFCNVILTHRVFKGKVKPVGLKELLQTRHPLSEARRLITAITENINIYIFLKIKWKKIIILRIFISECSGYWNAVFNEVPFVYKQERVLNGVALVQFFFNGCPINGFLYRFTLSLGR